MSHFSLIVFLADDLLMLSSCLHAATFCHCFYGHCIRSRRGKIRTGRGNSKGRGCLCCHAMVAHKLLIAIIHFLPCFMLFFSAKGMRPMLAFTAFNPLSQTTAFRNSIRIKASTLGAACFGCDFFATAFLSICSVDSERRILRGRVE